MNQDLSKLGWMGDNQNGGGKRKSDGEYTTDGVRKSDDVENELSKSINSTEEIPPPMFDIISAVSVLEDDNLERKYVLYTVRVRHGSARADLHTTTIDRRYTDFLTLYETLKKDGSEQLSSYTFPRKAIVGNFSQRLINERSKKFEQLLELISKDSKLRSSIALLNFLQDKELKIALELCGQQRYDIAEPILKNSFRLLNKVYTDRSAAVLLSLCRLVGCYAVTPGTVNGSAERWATLALHRYEGVSDADLLMLYGPLLETCLKLWERNGKDWQLIKERLADMKRRGVCMPTKTLLEAVNDLDINYRGLPSNYFNA